jgi:CRP-like cAMP-binding protein
LLPHPTLEQLAACTSPVTVPAGEVVIRSGEPGDRFYLVLDGTLDVQTDDGRRSAIGPGGFFGEIALLRDVPRTATVRATSDSKLLALDRDDFIAAVTGHAPSARAADAVVATRLGTLRPGATG